MFNNKLREIRSAPTECAHCPVRKKALFQVISDDYLEEAASRRTAQYQLPARTCLYQESTPALMAFTLFDGWLLLYRTHSDGSRQGLRIALPGDFVGFASGTERQYSHSALAVTDSVVCGFRQADLQQMMGSHPDIANQIAQIHVRYLQNCETNVLGLGRKSAEQRIAHAVVDLYRRLEQRGEVDAENHSMPFPLTQEMLGELTGLTPVHTNRVLRKLRVDGLMVAERRTLRVLDMPRLLDLAEYRDSLPD